MSQIDRDAILRAAQATPGSYNQQVSARQISSRADPNAYELDPQTGEHHRILYRHAEGNLVDARPYQQVRTDRLKIHQARDGLALAAGLGALGLVIAIPGLGLPENVQPWAGLAVLLFIGSLLLFVGAGLGWLGFGYQINKHHPLPPQPVARADNSAAMMEAFRNQNALGDARLATPGEVHAALARKEMPPPPRRFTD